MTRKAIKTGERTC